jgi:hypothetical protein
VGTFFRLVSTYRFQNNSNERPDFNGRRRHGLPFFNNKNQARRKLKDKDLAVLGRQTAAHPQFALPQIRFLFI